MNSGMSQSYTTQRDKNISKLTGYAANGRRFDERNTEADATLANQVTLMTTNFHFCIIVPAS